jgi:hypothetical protein
MQVEKLPERKTQSCPFRSRTGAPVRCSKEGGVCSIRPYDSANGVTTASAISGLRATCPNRFQEEDLIYGWVSKEILNSNERVIIGEVPFLQSEAGTDEAPDAVGRIDNVLLAPDTSPMIWCALEIQGVYFSGDAMSKDFKAIANGDGELTLPAGKRRPDDRSFGPKRLMPQLQIKVPTLRRWGKKMAVVIDRGFFDALGRMDNVKDVSNCDVAWFVVDFDTSVSPARLVPAFVRLTTLERAVEGLTGGVPVTLPEFETRIKKKAAKAAPVPPDLQHKG